MNYVFSNCIKNDSKGCTSIVLIYVLLVQCERLQSFRFHQNGDLKSASFFDKEYKITTGFFLENTIVVAEGEMLLEGLFQVGVILHCLETWPTKYEFCTNSVSNFYAPVLEFNFGDIDL